MSYFMSLKYATDIFYACSDASIRCSVQPSRSDAHIELQEDYEVSIVDGVVNFDRLAEAHRIATKFKCELSFRAGQYEPTVLYKIVFSLQEPDPINMAVWTPTQREHYEARTAPMTNQSGL